MSTTHSIPEHSKEILQLLMRGYQFSRSDRSHAKQAPLYHVLTTRFDFFDRECTVWGYALVNDDGVIFIEDDERELSNEEKQTVVVLWLYVDLALEQGISWADLTRRPIAWRDFAWFQEGYGADYLTSVKITSLDDINALWTNMERKGLLVYRKDSQTVTLRDPAERIINKAIDIHKHFRQQEVSHGNHE